TFATKIALLWSFTNSHPQIIPASKNALLNPHKLRKSAIHGDIPYLHPDPFPSLEAGGETEGLASEGVGVFQEDLFTIDLASIAGDDLHEMQREGPVYLQVDLCGSLAVQLDGLTRALSIDGKRRQQHLPGRHKELPAFHGIQYRLPAFLKLGELVHLQIVNIHVAIDLIIRLELEQISLSDRILFMSPVGHVIHQVQHPSAQTGLGEVSGNGFPGRPEEAVRMKKCLILILVRKSGGTLGAGMGGPG